MGKFVEAMMDYPKLLLLFSRVLAKKNYGLSVSRGHAAFRPNLGHLPGDGDVLGGDGPGQDQMDIFHRGFPQTDRASGQLSYFSFRFSVILLLKAPKNAG